MKAGIMMSETSLTKKHWKFFAQWSFLNLLGWGIGFGFAIAVQFLMDIRNVGTLWVALFFFFLFGGSIGILQWFEFRKFRINLFKWTFLTALGWSIGCSIWFMLVFEVNYLNWANDFFIHTRWIPLFLYEHLPIYRSNPYIVMGSINIGLCVIAAIIGAVISGAIIGRSQLVMVRKVILRPVLWIRAYVFGLLVPTIFAGLIYLVKAFLKKILFSFTFLPYDFLYNVLDKRWTLVFWFSIIMASLSISILTGKVLLKQSNKAALPRPAPQQVPYTARRLLETLPGNFTNFLKQRGTRIGLMCLVVFSTLPFLLYFGYCWGWWGRDSLLLQYYFQCKCPSGSEKARYPKEVEILVSPCNLRYVKLSPGGRFLYLDEDRDGRTSLLDLETGQQTPIPEITDFMTDNMAFKMHINGGGSEDVFVIDIATGQQYPIRYFRDLQPNAYRDGQLNRQMLIDTLQQAQEIYMVNFENSIIVLMSKFPTNTEKNFLLDRGDLDGDALKVPLKKFLADNSIHYTVLTGVFLTQTVSPDGRFIARDDGIYLVATGQKIVAGLPRLLVMGWVSDGSGAIYTAWDEPCWPGFSISGIFSACEIRVTQPVIKLKVPVSYKRPIVMSPNTVRPAPDFLAVPEPQAWHSCEFSLPQN
jgi:hypothetical protein